MQSAVWWTPPREDGEQREDGKRTLFGEIHLSPKLKPMLVVPDFKLYVRRASPSSSLQVLKDPSVHGCSDEFPRYRVRAGTIDVDSRFECRRRETAPFVRSRDCDAAREGARRNRACGNAAKLRAAWEVAEYCDGDLHLHHQRVQLKG